MNSRIKWIFAFLLVLGTIPVAPQTPSGEKGKETRAAAKPEGTRATPATDNPDYVIGADDVLDINVWKEPDVSRTVPVRPDGKISLPLLQDIQAARLTPLQLQARITEGLKKYLSDPQVTVIVTAVNSRRVYILGEVSRTGALPLLMNMTVLQALSAAGGFREFADLKKIYVMRKENGKQTLFPFNYKDVVRGIHPEQNIELKPGDTIIVP